MMPSNSPIPYTYHGLIVTWDEKLRNDYKKVIAFAKPAPRPDYQLEYNQNCLIISVRIALVVSLTFGEHGK